MTDNKTKLEENNKELNLEKGKDNNTDIENYLDFIVSANDKAVVLKMLSNIKNSEFDLKTFLKVVNNNALAIFLNVLKEELKHLPDSDKIFFNKTFNWFFEDSKVKNIKSICNRFVDLGKFLSDDNTFDVNSILPLESNTSESAFKQRAELLSNQEFLNALNDKFHVRHQDVLMQLNTLNDIISKSKQN